MYKFSIDPQWCKKEHLEFLKNKKMPKGSVIHNRQHYLDRTIAACEFPTFDIELEAWRRNGDEIEDMSSNSTMIKLSYFTCIKGIPKDDFCIEKDGMVWESYEYTNTPVKINFNNKNWKKQLEQEMYDTAIKYAKNNNLSLTEPNFDYRKKG